MERKWWTLVLISIATFMLLLDITVVNVALPDIQRDLDASLSSLQWVVDAYSLTLAAFLLTAGSLGDRLGGAVSSLSGSESSRSPRCSAGCRRPDAAQPGPRPAGCRRRGDVRDLAGADRPGVQRARDRATAFAVWGATVGGAVAMGRLGGGLITEDLGWEWIFLSTSRSGLAADRPGRAAARQFAAHDPPADRPGRAS